jgi:hypothetical protein
MISPNLLDIWPVFFLILSRYETAHLLILLRLPDDGYSRLGSKKMPPRICLFSKTKWKLDPIPLFTYYDVGNGCKAVES